MTVKVLIIDPDISFTVPVKRALEISGNYKVNVFASGRPALEVLQRDPHDVAILDFGVDDMDMPGLIQAIRDIQPWIFVLVTPRTSAQIEQVPTLDVQGSITKPYFARQIGPVIREATLARARYTRSQQEPPAATEPDAPTEPSIRPDDTFRRVVATLHTEDHPSDQPPVPPIEALPIPDDATLRELVSGTPRSAPPGQTPPPALRPESLPEPPPEPPALQDVTTFAAIALEVADDATVPLEHISRALSDRAESLPPETRPTIQPLPPWVPETTPDESTLVGNALPAESATAPAAVPDAAAESDAPEADGERALDAEMAETFAGLLPPEERSPTEGAAETPSQAAAPPADRPAESAAALASLALDLTQLTVESAAQSSVLSRDGELIAKTGALSVRDVKALLEEIAHTWQASEPTPPPGGGAPPRPARFRYVQLPGGGDYLMYSARTVEDMILTMLFPGDIPLKTIRRQAAQLLEALERVPEAEAESAPAPEPEAATTLPSRPTDPHPPAGLREAIGAPEGVEAVEAEGEVQPPTDAQVPAVERTSYAFAWLPRQDELPVEIVAMLPGWLETIAAEHGWELDGAEVQPTYVTVQIHIPATEAPAAVVHTLMRETALRSEDAAIWADPSYIISPARDVTQQEIAAFIEYRRESQSAS
jgi:DNA-binding NarL/FixJ family response regulator